MPSSAFGAAGEFAAWKEVLAAYYDDRLEAAYKAAIGLGVGSTGFGESIFRMIEAEQMTRERSVSERPFRWLELEWIAEEGLDASSIASMAQEAMHDVASRLHVARCSAVLLTILPPEANMPWAPGRDGYCVRKARKMKVCLPRALVGSDEMPSALRHEFGHAVAAHTARTPIPTWLDEAVATTMGGDLAPTWRTRFSRNPELWLGPTELDLAFRADRESHDGREIVTRAYQQAALIGRHIVEAGRGERALGRILKAHTALNLMALFVGPTHAAIRRVVGRAPKRLFADALASLSK